MNVLARSEANAPNTEHDESQRDMGLESVPVPAENKFQKAIAAWRSELMSSIVAWTVY